ncbi:mycothiol transferase [Nocardioides terrisoli]|uniref:mycothiol transferase n=1 Tax=Nocardioides terrisoli TaxID=3388267 RepID=UPI00287B6395|nr:DUF664 domain-containing protein [Nocardioides marmorisolisilvae]
MDVNELLTDELDRVRTQVPQIVEGLDDDALCWRPGPEGNTIAWLVWHLTRIQDDHLAAVAGLEQAWTAAGWYERFDLPFPAEDHGFGHSAEQVGQVRVGSRLLAGYHGAVADRYAGFVGGLTASDLDEVVDTRWDPPVTLGVRLASVVGEVHAHAGQAAFVRGLWERRTR